MLIINRTKKTVPLEQLEKMNKFRKKDIPEAEEIIGFEVIAQGSFPRDIEGINEIEFFRQKLTIMQKRYKTPRSTDQIIITKDKNIYYRSVTANEKGEVFNVLYRVICKKAYKYYSIKTKYKDSLRINEKTKKSTTKKTQIDINYINLKILVN